MTNLDYDYWYEQIANAWKGKENMSMGRRFKMEDMSAEPKKEEFSLDFIKKAWPQAKGELSGFANALDRGNAGITADQIRMAVALADEAYAAKFSS